MEIQLKKSDEYYSEQFLLIIRVVCLFFLLKYSMFTSCDNINIDLMLYILAKLLNILMSLRKNSFC